MRPNWKTDYVRYRSLFLNLVSKYKKRDDVKVYLELLLSLATVSIFAVFALRPTLLTISRLIKEIDSKKKTIEQMDNKIDDLSQAQRAFDRQRSNINMLKIAIPSTADPDVVLRQLEGVVNNSGVEVTEFNVGNMTIIPASSNQTEQTEDTEEQEQTNDVKEIVLSISTTSDYINLLRLVSALENSRKPFNIKITEFSYAQEEDSTILTLTIDAGLPIVNKQTK